MQQNITLTLPITQKKKLPSIFVKNKVRLCVCVCVCGRVVGVLCRREEELQQQYTLYLIRQVSIRYSMTLTSVSVVVIFRSVRPPALSPL